MEASTRTWLYDPSATRDLVLAHRSATTSVVSVVVSDLVWGDVVRLLRWADAGLRGDGHVESGTWWRLAASCADLLRRLPGLAAELGEPWHLPPAPDDDRPSGREQVAHVAERLAARLASGRPLLLATLAAEVDALGAAAIGALAEGWVSPEQR
jgi:hypothetical protein